MSETFVVIPKFQVVPSEISHDVHNFLCWEIQQLGKLLDRLQNS